MNRTCFTKHTTEPESSTKLNLHEQKQHVSCIPPIKNYFLRKEPHTKRFSFFCLFLLCLFSFEVTTYAQTVTSAQWLQSQTKPVFKTGNTLPQLGHIHCLLPPSATMAELATNWGYNIELSKFNGGPDPTLVTLANSNPSKYKIAVRLGNLSNVFTETGYTAPSNTWLRTSGGALVDGRQIVSPEAPDAAFQVIINECINRVQTVDNAVTAPIAFINNWTEYWLGLPYDSAKYAQDPAVVAAKGSRTWMNYISERKAYYEKKLYDAMKAQWPNALYSNYGYGGLEQPGDEPYVWAYKYTKVAADYPGCEMYYNYFNSGYIGSNDMLREKTHSRGVEIAEGSKFSYDWLCAGYTRDVSQYGGDPSQGVYSDLPRWMGYLKMSYISGMISGLTTGEFSLCTSADYPTFNSSTPPKWLDQMPVLSHAHALFTWLEPYFLNSDLLTGPGSHAWNAAQPAYEFPTGFANTRVMARKVTGVNQWIIGAWAADGVQRNVTVNIPGLGNYTITARAEGTVRFVAPDCGKDLWCDQNGMAPSLTAQDLDFSSCSGPYLPTVTTTGISSITQTTASGGGNVTADGGAAVTARGICWATTANPTTANSKTTNGTGTGTFTSSITSLTANTTYHVRAYATNSVGTSYGADVTFTTTGSPTAPVVTTTSVTNITETAASSGGNVTADGGAAVTARGVCWATTANPTTANSKTTNGTGTGTFTSSITGLTANTTYHVRAYATNSVGTSYGADVTFTTQAPAGNTVSVFTTQTPAGSDTDGPYELGMKFRSTAAGQITKIRYYKVAAETGSHTGRIWSSSGTLLASASFTGETTSGWQEATLGTPLNISANTNYVVSVNSNSAYGYINQGLQTVITNGVLSSIADGANGVYGNTASFPANSWQNSNYFRDIVFSSGSAISLPTVSTTAVSAITQTSASSGGNVTADGGASVTARGICWATTANPTTANSKTTNGTGTGTFTSSITGLTAATTYHVRAYATNSAGTSYGSDITFTTSGATATNLITPNPGFESDLASWVNYGGTTIVTSNQNSGAKAAQVTGSSAGFNRVITGLKASTAYTLKAWGKRSDANQWGYVEAKDYGSGQTNSNITTTTYSQVTINFTTGATNTTATVGVWKLSGSGSIWFDDFELFESAALKSTNVSTKIPVNKEASGSVNIYPNPATTSLTVDFGTVVESTVIQLLDLAGRVLLTEVVSNKSETVIVTSSLGKGAYIIKANGETKIVLIK